MELGVQSARSRAGHPPALLRDHAGITSLGATGLPLGLFSHTTQSAAACHLTPGSALLVVSRGIVEASAVETECADTEFGLDAVRQSLQQAMALSARDLCLAALQATQRFTLTAPTHNDLTALALVRNTSHDVV